jgi:nucleoside-diphosphate-sugar epimerase
MVTPRDIIKERLATERVLVMGAGGWFGREFLALTRDIETLGTGSHAREIEVDGQVHQVIEYDIKAVEKFKPTVVIDCAGLNRHYQHKLTFLYDCLDLTLNYLRVMALPSVRAGLTFSSGAATFDPLGDQFSEYSASKMTHEHMARETDKPGVIMRCYAVTGRHCQERDGYAVTNFLDQARGGKVTVHTATPTYRRYMAIDEYAAVGISQLGKRTTIESGGYWIEMGQLAGGIARAFGAKVSRRKVAGSPDSYGASDNKAHRIASELNLKISTVPEQVATLL